MYKQFIKPFLFCFKPETSYHALLRLVKFSHFVFGPHLIKLTHHYESPKLGRDLFGIDFKNPVGLAAGFDTNGEYVNDLANYGFSFIEIGSLSPNPQSGPGKPRVTRIRKDKALISRMGGRNRGVKYAISKIENRQQNFILSASIIPDSQSHKDEEMIRDTQLAFSMMYDFADMFTINLSTPNESGVLTVQDATSLADIMDPLLELRLCYDIYKPILIKVSPDIPYEQLDEILDYCMLSGVDGIIAGGAARRVDSLTCSERKKNSISNGCLSGAPLFQNTLNLVKHINEHTKGRFPIVGCGGIMSPEQAAQILGAGASLIQINTGLLFEGPKLVKKILKHLAAN